MRKQADVDVVIVGAGIADLVAARELVSVGLRVVILEKSRGVGGRMATRRLGSAVCDHGAQFFTVRGRAFGSLVYEAHEKGMVTQWCDGFSRATANGSGMLPPGGGHPRWRGTHGMTSLPKYIVSQIDGACCSIRTGVKVQSVGIEDGIVRIVLEDGDLLRASAAMLTAPVPQSLDLMKLGQLVPDEIAPPVLQTLSGIVYDPCFALMLQLDRPSRVPSPGGIQFEAEGFEVVLTELAVSQIIGFPLGLTAELSNPSMVFYPAENEFGCAYVSGIPFAPGDYVITVYVVANVTVESVGFEIAYPTEFNLYLTVNPGSGGNNSFAYSPNNGCEDLDVNFEALITSEEYDVEYIWDFGNGVTSNEQYPPIQVYDEPGDYEVSLVTNLTSNTIELSSFTIDWVSEDCYGGDFEEY